MTQEINLVCNPDAGQGDWTSERLTAALAARGFVVATEHSASEDDLAAVLSTARGRRVTPDVVGDALRIDAGVTVDSQTRFTSA